MDDSQLMSALSGEAASQEAPSADSELITDPVEVEEILDDGASLMMGESPDDDGAIGAVGGIPQERDSLDEIRRQRDEAVAILQQQQQAAQQQAAYQYWEGSRQQAEAAFAAQERAIYQEAESAYDAAAYIKDKMSALNHQRDAWRTQYHSAREASLRQAAERMAVPSYAAEVASHFGLSDGDLDELMQFPPQMMPQVANLMAQRQTQKSRSKAARNVAQRSVAPGNGRSSGRIKAGSDAHLYALLRGVSD